MSSSTSAKDSARIRFYLFGHFRIERGSRSIQLPTRKAEALLAYLVLNPDKHARDKLAGTFWGESSEAEARNSLRNALATLNKGLGRDLILADRQSVAINSTYPLWVDALVFEGQASGLLAGSLADSDPVEFELYQGDLLSIP